MKKGVIGSLAVLSALALAACGNSNDTSQDAGQDAEGKTVIKFSALESGYGDQMWPEIVAAYEEVNPDVTIELDQNKDIETTLSTQVQAGNYPDVVMLATGREKGVTENFISEKALTDLTDVLDRQVPGEDETVQDKLLEGFTGNTVTDPYGDGKVYLMPMFYSPTGLFYDKGLFEEKGWEVPTTWDGMFELADIARDDDISLFTYPVAGYLDSFLPPVLAAAGGTEFFDRAMNFDEGVWDSADADKMFDMLGRLAEDVEPTTVANANQENFKKNQQLVIDDQALFMPNGSWIVDEMADTTPEDFQWGMTAYPSFDADGDQYAWSFFEQIWVPADAENAEAAKDFIAFLYSDQAAEIFAKANAVQPIETFPYDQLSEANQVFYDVYKNGAKPLVGSFVQTEAVAGVDFAGTLYKTMDSVVNGSKTAKEWQEEVKEMMDTLRDHKLD